MSNRFLIVMACLTLLRAAVRADDPARVVSLPQTTLKLSPGPGNPRNSEGDFIALRDGHLMFVYTHFTAGGGDHDHAWLAGRISADQGQTWSNQDTVVLQNEGTWNVMSVSLLRLVDGRIAMFYMRKNSLTDCRPYLRYSTDEARTWSDPQGIIPDEAIGYYVLNNDRVVQLASGRLVVPVALHNRPTWDQPDWAGHITCYLSDDAGQSWRRSETLQAVHSPGGRRITAQEPGVLQMQDGSLMMWVRTNAGQQYVAQSTDQGDSWTAFKPMGVASPLAPASIERIPQTGDLLMVWNDHSDLPLSQRRARTPLTIALSQDEGKTWKRICNISDDPNGWYCYTAIEFADGNVLLAHVAGQQAAGRHLATTHIRRFPVSWLYDQR